MQVTWIVGDDVRSGAGRSKHQDPRSREDPNSKIQVPCSSRDGGWILEFGSSLDLGSSMPHSLRRLLQFMLFCIASLVSTKALKSPAKQLLHVALQFPRVELPAGLSQRRIFLDQNLGDDALGVLPL